ncbi:MAG TPA: hypothetical protein VNC78_05445 [Actinomycetota bacterium]|nr:hypothetical protein [Actinomycetota bacterium]
MKRFIALIAGMTLLLGACGGDDAGTPEVSADAKATFTSAVQALAEGPGITATLSVLSDSASLQAMAADEGDEMSAETADKILSSSLSISAKNTTDPKEAASQILINIAGTDAFEVRVLGYNLFLRADARSIATTFGQDPAGLDMLAQQAAAGGMGFVKDALDGKWLAIEGLDQLTKSLTGQDPSAAAAQQQEMVDQFAQILSDSSTVGSEGEDEFGEHLVATFPLRALFDNFKELVAGSGIPGAEFPDSAEVPDESITLDVWVRDGKVTQIVFDFMQIAEIEDEEIPEGVEQLGLKIELAEFAGTVEEPADAVKIDPMQIMGLFMGMPGPDAGGGGMDDYSSGFPCETLKGEPREVLIQFKKECPHLLKKR